jgi:hypothetical protein
MANLPPNSDFTGATATQGAFKATLNSLLDFIRESVGSTGGAANWRAALGLGTRAAANEVTAGLLGAGAVTTANPGEGRVTVLELAPAPVVSAEPDAGAVTTAQIGDGRVTVLELAPAPVVSAEPDASAVTTAQIGEGRVASAKPPPAVPPGVPAGTVVAYDGSATPTG